MEAGAELTAAGGVRTHHNLDLCGRAAEAGGVNTKSFGRYFLALGLFVALLGSAAAADSKSTREAMGDDTYAITRKATSAFHRDVDALKAEAQDDAAKYCASLGRQMKVLSLTADKPRFSLGYANARIVFKALNAGDPELTGAVATTQGPIAAPPPGRITSTSDLYNDLIKLDDLRKKGVLTDEEFQSEKKKVLARSQ
jgi:hypothetical protein